MLLRNLYIVFAEFRRILIRAWIPAGFRLRRFVQGLLTEGLGSEGRLAGIRGDGGGRGRGGLGFAADVFGKRRTVLRLLLFGGRLLILRAGLRRIRIALGIRGIERRQNLLVGLCCGRIGVVSQLGRGGG